MLVPVSWLRSMLPGLTAEPVEIAARLVRAGLEVERVHHIGGDLPGVVLGAVRAIEDLTGFKKPIRYCLVDVGAGAPRGIVCGARNFAEGDVVAVALPGAVLPGGVPIAARDTYGRRSEGMICSAQELGVGEDRSGILVLGSAHPAAAGAPAPLGSPASSLLADDVLDISVTPDRGYALSMRGIARETATAFGLDFVDPGLAVLGPTGDGFPVRVEDAAGCPFYVLAEVQGLGRHAATPGGAARRLTLAGMRPVSPAVDVTNLVMLELGQPLHAFDRDRVQGPIVVRRAVAGERLRTLDGVDRSLHPADLVIADDLGPVALAGVMGGERTEIGPGTRSVLVEAAHFEAVSVARTARRHKLVSEASRRFERQVDSALPPAAAARAVALLAEFGGARGGPVTMVGAPALPTPIAFDPDAVTRLAGRRYPREVVRARLADVGCGWQEPAGSGPVTISPPSWRPDLLGPADLVEEVVRLEGLDTIPVRVPRAPAGRGLTLPQRRRRAVGRALAAAGYVEVSTVPFTGPDPLGLPAEDPRRAALRLANPLADSDAWLRTSMLPGLLTALAGNVARGRADVALFELGSVVRGHPGEPAVAAPAGTARPSPAELAALAGALPEQRQHAGVVLCGHAEPGGWWGPGRDADWADPVEAARLIAAAAGLELAVEPAAYPPWHPGRCAALLLGARVVGHAGELHPAACSRLGVPARTCALELDLGALLDQPAAAPAAPRVSAFPLAVVDVALVAPGTVPHAAVAAALQDGAGPWLEELRLFDVYTGPQLPAGHRSLAYSLTFRAPDRTLTGDEVNAARDAAVAEAGRRTGAVLRS